MAPNVVVTTGVLHETDEEINSQAVPIVEVKKPGDFKVQMVWRNAILFAYLHLSAVYGLLLMFISAKYSTSLWGKFLKKNNLYVVSISTAQVF